MWTSRLGQTKCLRGRLARFGAIFPSFDHYDQYYPPSCIESTNSFIVPHHPKLVGGQTVTTNGSKFVEHMKGSMADGLGPSGTRGQPRDLSLLGSLRSVQGASIGSECGADLHLVADQVQTLPE